MELSKLLATCPSEFLEENNLWKKFFCQFWFWNENFLAFRRIFFRGVVKTAFYVSIGTIWRKKNSPTKIVFYQTLTNSEHFWPLAGTFPTGFSKRHSTCSLKQFQKKSFWKKCSFIHNFGKLIEFFLSFWLFFDWIKKTASYVSVGKVWGNLFSN